MVVTGVGGHRPIGESTAPRYRGASAYILHGATRPAVAHITGGQVYPALGMAGRQCHTAQKETAGRHVRPFVFSAHRSETCCAYLLLREDFFADFFAVFFVLFLAAFFAALAASFSFIAA